MENGEKYEFVISQRIQMIIDAFSNSAMLNKRMILWQCQCIIAEAQNNASRDYLLVATSWLQPGLVATSWLQPELVATRPSRDQLAAIILVATMVATFDSAMIILPTQNDALCLHFNMPVMYYSRIAAFVCKSIDV